MFTKETKVEIEPNTEKAMNILKTLAEVVITQTTKTISSNYNDAMEIFHKSGSGIFKIIAQITEIYTSTTYYMECPVAKCSKKVDKLSNTLLFYCKSCKETFNVYKHHILLTMKILFDDNTQTVTAFNTVSEKILKINSSKFGAMSNCKPNELVHLIQSLLNKTFNFEIKITQNKLNNQTQLIIENVEDIIENEQKNDEKPILNERKRKRKHK